MFWVILGVIAILMLLNSTLGQALAGRIEGSNSRETDELLGRRISVLEGEVDRLGTEVRRLEEESEFLHKLLGERPPQKKDLPSGDSAD